LTSPASATVEPKFGGEKFPDQTWFDSISESGSPETSRLPDPEATGSTSPPPGPGACCAEPGEIPNKETVTENKTSAEVIRFTTMDPLHSGQPKAISKQLVCNIEANIVIALKWELPREK
ncbi:MAG: hypothetical protein ABGY28_09590, partial [bacterium]